MAEERIEKNSAGVSQGFNAGLLIPAGIFLGMAYGFYSGNLIVGITAGLGLGFLLMAVSSLFTGSNEGHKNGT